MNENEMLDLSGKGWSENIVNCEDQDMLEDAQILLEEQICSIESIEEAGNELSKPAKAKLKILKSQYKAIEIKLNRY